MKKSKTMTSSRIVLKRKDSNVYGIFSIVKRLMTFIIIVGAFCVLLSLFFVAIRAIRLKEMVGFMIAIGIPAVLGIFLCTVISNIFYFVQKQFYPQNIEINDEFILFKHKVLYIDSILGITKHIHIGKYGSRIFLGTIVINYYDNNRNRRLKIATRFYEDEEVESMENLFIQLNSKNTIDKIETLRVSDSNNSSMVFLKNDEIFIHSKMICIQDTLDYKKQRSERSSGDYIVLKKNKRTKYLIKIYDTDGLIKMKIYDNVYRYPIVISASKVKVTEVILKCFMSIKDLGVPVRIEILTYCRVI